MAGNLELMLEAERRGILPPERKAALDEARRRGLVAGGDASAEFAQRAAAMDPADLSVARSKNDEFGAYLRAQAQARKPGETDEEMARRQYGSLSGTERPGAAEGVTRAALHGLTFGAGDEIVAGGTAALDAALRGEDFGRAYDARLGRERQQLEQFRDDSPVLAYGAEIAGAIPTAVATAPAATGRLATRVLGGAATGATQGGVYGFNAGEGGARSRLASGGQGAAVGGVIGAAAPAVGAGVRNVVERVQTGRNAAALGVPRAAHDVLMRAAQADDTLTGEGARRVARGGADAMLADAGPNMSALLDTAVQRSGPAATQARRAIDQRATAAGQAVKQVLDDTLGAPQGVKAAETALRTGTQAARSNAYQAAYSRPINYADDVGREIEDIVRHRVPASAIRKANELMRTEGVKSGHILARIADDGTVTLERLPDVRQLDYITRALQEVAEQADGAGKLGGTTATGRAYASLKSELRGLMRQAVPEYGQALDTAADPISKRAALRLGQRALSASMQRDEFAEEIAGMSAAERQFVGQGIRSQLDDAMANVRRALTDANMDAREAIKAIRTLTTRASREKIEALLGPDRAGQLFDKIDESLAAFELRAAVAENSKTFVRTAADDSIKRQADDGVVNALRSGRPLEGGKRLAQKVLGRTVADKERIADETYGALTSALTGPRGAQALELVRRMEAAGLRAGPTIERSRLIAEGAARANAGVTGPAIEPLRRRK